MGTYKVIRKRKKIPDKIYREIRRVFPIVCVDVVITNGKKFLLAKRTNQPEKNKWWIPGGRILKNELLKDAAFRVLKQETGLRGKTAKFLVFDELFHSPGYFPGATAHNIAFVFKMNISGNKKFNLDSQNSEAKWFSKIEPSWHPYVKRFLKEAGFK
ncbi:MAG: NUDIX domain-containing protein [Patescibacteria group bacterium]